MANYINLATIAFSSFSATLQDLTPNTSSLVVTAGTSIPASSSTTRTVSVLLPTTLSDSIDRVQITGTGVAAVDNFSFITSGYIEPKNSGTYLISVVTSNTATTRNFLFIIKNNTGAPVILPELTLSAYCRFYNYPWTS